MINYIKNKNFIPDEFVDFQNRSKEKGDRKGVIILLIINLILMPLNVVAITKNVEKEEKIEVVENNEVEKFNYWLNLFEYENVFIVVENGVGKIKTNDKDIIYSLDHKGYKIKEIIKENSEYTIQLEQ